MALRIRSKIELAVVFAGSRGWSRKTREGNERDSQRKRSQASVFEDGVMLCITDPEPHQKRRMIATFSQVAGYKIMQKSVTFLFTMTDTLKPQWVLMDGPSP